MARCPLAWWSAIATRMNLMFKPGVRNWAQPFCGATAWIPDLQKRSKRLQLRHHYQTCFCLARVQPFFLQLLPALLQWRHGPTLAMIGVLSPRPSRLGPSKCLTFYKALGLPCSCPPQEGHMMRSHLDVHSGSARPLVLEYHWY